MVEMPMALLFFGIIGYCLWRTGGQYSELFVFCFVGAYVAYAARFLKGRSAAFKSEGLAYAVLIFFLICLMQKPFLLYASPGTALSVVRFSVGAALFCGAALAFARYRDLSRTWWAAFGGLCVALAVARTASLMASPEPIIDVFSKTRLAIEYLVAGKNPYAQIYPVMYGGALGDYTGFPYLPGVLYWGAPFHWVCRDFRVGYVVADIGSALLLFAMARRGQLPARVAGLMSALWLAFPVSLLILEQSWTDTLLIFAAAAMFFAVNERRFFLAGMVAGFLVVVKQYGFFIPLLPLFWLWTAKREPDSAVRMTGALLLTSGLLLAPFLVIDARVFIFNTIGAFGGLGMRPDSFSLIAWLHNRAGVEMPSAVSGVLYLAALVAVLWAVRRRSQADAPVAGLAVFFSLLFLFGRQAFCNYYQLVAYLVLAAGTMAGASSKVLTSRR